MVLVEFLVRLGVWKFLEMLSWIVYCLVGCYIRYVCGLMWLLNCL